MEKVDDAGLQVHLRLGSMEKMIAVPEERLEQVKGLVRTILTEPFTKRPWSELFYFGISSIFAAVGAAFIFGTMGLGVVLAVTFVGVILIGCCIRGARGIGSIHRNLARALLDERIEEPAAFAARPGLFGWIQSSLRDRVGWRAVAYSVVKLPIIIIGIYFAFSIWVDAFGCLSYPLLNNGNVGPPGFGVIKNVFWPGYLSVGQSGIFHGLFIFLSGVILFFLAPWAMRAFLGPDALTLRTRSLEQARTQTVDASAATLRRIERDLHDGTQAQLVAIAMRLGQAKEKLAKAEDPELEPVRSLIDEAHKGAKEAIIELRDLARGIHPPALDTGLEGALSTLTARSTIPSDLTVSMFERPTPAIEAIAYFCVAELLANVAQHAHASKASISCIQHGRWLRIVVRDDGQGGAHIPTAGSSSSGLSGLTDRVSAVDGQLVMMSPIGGPTVVTVDLPLQA
ncbi:MAG: sensor domain-containing protein [Acidimicrobiales bacterium]